MNNPIQGVHPDLQAIEDARAAGDFDTTRALSTAYVQAHPDEFADHRGFGDGEEGRAATVKLVETYRDLANDTPELLGLRNNQYRAEAWHFHSWDPVNIGGSVHQIIKRNV